MSVRNDSHSRVILMGDLCDAILVGDKRWENNGLAEWVERDNIMESQRRKVVELFSPIKNKILCALTGNHEEKVHSTCQVDTTRNICSDLGIDYGGYQSIIVLNFNRKNSNQTTQIKLHAWHGAGAAQSPGARTLRLMALATSFDVDIVLMGHLHAKNVYTTTRLGVNQEYKITAKPIHAACTGAWLKAYEQGGVISYAERAGFKPTDLGTITVEIKPSSRDITIKV
jgi:predicted phosphodiesterase